MSRHRFVRNMNIHEELDGGYHDDEDPFEGITPDQQVQLDSATETVMNLLGAQQNTLLSENEIRHVLWDNYFEVDPTLDWAFSEQKRRQAARDKRDDSTPREEVDSSPIPPQKRSLAQLAARPSPTTPTSLASLASQRPRTSLMSPATTSKSSRISSSPLSSLNASTACPLPNPSTTSQSPSNMSQTPNPGKPPSSNKPSKLAALARASPLQSRLQASSARPGLAPTPPPTTNQRPPSKLALKVQSTKTSTVTQPTLTVPDLPAQSCPPTSVDPPQASDDKDHERDPSVDDILFSTSDLDPAYPSTLPGVTVPLSSYPSPFASLLLETTGSSGLPTAYAGQGSPLHIVGAQASLERLSHSAVLFTFDTPSPDDIVQAKREGTRLAAGRSYLRLTLLYLVIHKEKKAAAKQAAAHPSTKATSTPPTPKKSSQSIMRNPGPSTSTQGRSALSTPRNAALGLPTSSSTPTAKATLKTHQISQLSADVDALGLGDMNREEPVEVDVAAPKIRLSREKLLEEATQTLDRKGKKSLSLVIVGHVDAGKSTLMGRLLYELGQMEEKRRRENERESTKIGKASFLWAWEMDGLSEERERGVTIDINLTTMDLPHTSLTILDAPGHKDFIPNMISGASQADAALLVIDATVGEFEAGFAGGGQSREHVILVRSLGVGTIVVAINKMDMVKYSQDRYEEICSVLKPFLAQSGYHPSRTTFVPCAGMAGVNLVDTTAEGANELRAWYKGPTLVEALDSLKPPGRPIDAPLRFPVSNVFRGGGGTLASGIGVSGRLVSGVVQVGEKLRILPGDESAVVRVIENENTSVPWAAAGSNVTLYLMNVDPVHLSIGSVLCPPSDLVPLASTFIAQIIVFEIQVPITTGASVELFHHSRDNPATISKLIATLDRTTGSVIKDNPRVLTKNSSAKILLTLRSGTLSGPSNKQVSIPIETFAANKEMGRILLRRGGETIAAGIVLEISS
ncbi:Hsp70 suppressor, GTPase facilitates ribosomal subunit dissociation [Tulasnella sp. 403]|nr:Hsp70 suppressor, GTPase facilitates ribosomal subunit dissociation [Tulasnella sp. 403]